MADEGWEIEVICPHGVKLRGPLAVLRGFLPLEDVCKQAKMEKALNPPPLSRREKRKFRRLIKNLTAPNVEPPPSSETKETP